MKALKQQALRTFLVCVVATSVLAPVIAQEDDQQQYVEPFDRTIALPANGSVSLSNIAGDIEIITWNRPEVRIQGLKVSRAATVEQARQNADLVTIDVKSNGNAVDISTKYPDGSNDDLRVSVEYKLTVPEPASVETRSVSGNIRLTGLRGNAQLASVSGDVEVDQIGGQLDARSVSGDVKAGEVSQNASCESVSGDVEVRGVGGETQAKSVSGNVLVEESSGPVAAESLSGDVRVIEAASAGLDIDASTFSGKIESDFDLRVSERGNRRLLGAVNGGGKALKARSFSGTVSLSRR
ncbi:MAG TPA: DUF4097 family beta strand repeat-containing protein [Acidobacteriota bacterium]|nr:DUF4097 family beta strand repeat-containing protein [Acidobacteriota bacterium]